MTTDVLPVLRDMRANTVRGVLLVTMVTRGCRAADARSVSVPCGGRCLDHVTLSRANAVAGSGHRGGRVTSAWTGMCVDQLGSSPVMMSARVC